MADPFSGIANIILIAVYPAVGHKLSVIAKPVIIAASLNPSRLHSASSFSYVSGGFKVIHHSTFLVPAGFHISGLVKIIPPVIDILPFAFNVAKRSLITPSFSVLNPVGCLKCYTVLTNSFCVNIVLIIIDPFVSG